MQQRQHIERIIIIIIIKRDLERSEEAYTCFWACNDITLSPKLKTGYRNENQFRTRVSRMSLSSFVDINIFVLKYYVFQFLYILHFFESLKSKSSQMLRPPKRKLDGFVQRYSFKFRALQSMLFLDVFIFLQCL